MTLTNWIIIYVANLLFWLWLTKLEGAEKIGDTPMSGIFTFLFTLKWREINAEGIRFFWSIVFILHTLFFILGIKVPAFRTMLGM